MSEEDQKLSYAGNLSTTSQAKGDGEDLSGSRSIDSFEYIAGEVRGYIVESFLLDPDELTAQTSLIGSGVIDSTGMMEVVDFVEESFGIEVDDRELIPENFDTVERLANFVISKRPQLRD